MPWLIQTPEDFLTGCVTYGDAVQGFLDVVNGILNLFGFFIPDARTMCLFVYNIIDPIMSLFLLV